MNSDISTDSQYRIKRPSIADGVMPPDYMLGADHAVPDAAVEQLERDGVICLRNVLDVPTVDALRLEAAHAATNPSPEARFVGGPDAPRMFYYEFNIWRRYPVLRRVVFDSHLPDIAQTLMRSESVTLYYTNTFVKDGGAPDNMTPWHEDASYHRLVGRNVINVNLICDPMPAATTLKCKQGSHLSGEPVYIGPTFERGVEYDGSMEHQVPMPDQDELDRRYRTVYWEVFPGDALVFYQRTLHAAPANSLDSRRHSFAVIMAGDGVGYDARSGPMDTPGHDPDLAHGAPPAGEVFPKLR